MIQNAVDALAARAAKKAGEWMSDTDTIIALRDRIKQKFGGRCAYCGVVLGERWHVDHIEPTQKGGSTNEGNLNPACARCNFRKGGCTLEEFRSEIEAQHERLLRDSSAYWLAIDYGVIEPTNRPVVFHFESIAHEQV